MDFNILGSSSSAPLLKHHKRSGERAGRQRMPLEKEKCQKSPHLATAGGRGGGRGGGPRDGRRAAPRAAAPRAAVAAGGRKTAGTIDTSGASGKIILLAIYMDVGTLDKPYRHAYRHAYRNAYRHP